jgi:hypothetical protein
MASVRLMLIGLVVVASDLVLPSRAMAQYRVEYFPAQNLHVIYSTHDGRELAIDSITTLSIFSDYSSVANDNVICILWRSTTLDGNHFFINTYIASEAGVELDQQYSLFAPKGPHQTMTLRLANDQLQVRSQFITADFALVLPLDPVIDLLGCYLRESP